MNMKKGFTLIELLIVVGIIGILASIVLSSLSTARGKGVDAAIKATLANARAQADFFYDASGTDVYNGVCLSTGGAENINSLIVSAGEKLNQSFASTDVGADGVAFVYDSFGAAPGSVVCHDSAVSWAAVVSLKSAAGIGWCVDSTGASREVTSLPANTYICPVS